MLFADDLLAQQKPTVAYKLTEKDIIAEGITHDPVGKAFYLSSIHKKKIVKITDAGVVSDFIKPGQDEFLEGLGMKVDAAGRLWACNNTPEYDSIRHVANVHVFDTKTGKLLKKYQLSDGRRNLFNDLYFTTSGDTYVTDSEGSALYVIRNGSETIEEFIAPGRLHYANGICGTTDDTHLYVSTSSGLGIAVIDIKTKDIQPLDAKYRVIGLDGLYKYKHRLIGMQNAFFPEAVMQLTLSEDNFGVDKIEFLTENQPEFDIPTTGVVVGDEFYFIANSQILRLMGNHGKIESPETLKETLIMKIKLN